jgi:hypothetical protein
MTDQFHGQGHKSVTGVAWLVYAAPEYAAREEQNERR